MVEVEAKEVMVERQRLRRQGQEGGNWCYIVSQVEDRKSQKGTLLATFHYYKSRVQEGERCHGDQGKVQILP
jgi:hypothetical protein